MAVSKYSGFERKLENASAFSFRAVESRMGRNYAKVFIYNLKKRGAIIELMKGWYSFKKSPYLITIPLAEAYIGLGAAASIHGAWEQVPNIDVLTTRAPEKIKVGERVVAGRKVIVRRISKPMYFGYEARRIEEAGEWVRVSDPEKTIIDIIYFNYPFAGEILPGLMEIADKGKLAGYLKRMKGVRGSKKIGKNVRRLLEEKRHG